MTTLLSFDYVKDFIQKEGYVLLSNSYQGSVFKMDMECPKGHAFPMSFKVFSKGHRCSYCAGKRQYNTKEVEKILSQYGYTLNTTVYLNNRQKLDLTGPDGKKYISSLFSIKIGGVLPHISSNTLKKENECRQFFENITGKIFTKQRPDWLRNPESGHLLELDGYCEELKLAFEYDGQFHFHSIRGSLTDGQFNRDRIKDKLCQKNNVRLIRVPYYIKNKYQYIYNEIHNSKKSIFIGDPHITIRNIEEGEKLIDFFIKTCQDKGVNHIVFLGDLFDGHNTIRLEVLHFWNKAFKKILKQYKITSLVGNHDMVLGDSEYSNVNAISNLQEKYKYTLNIIEEPSIIDDIGYISYTRNTDDFYEKCQHLYSKGATNTLVCHQTFQGACFENNFYAPDGVEINKIPQKLIISGHIHKQQTIGKVFYPGTPKWDKSTDAGEEKGIWLISDDTGEKEFLSTKDVVTPMYRVTIKEGEEIPEFPTNTKIAFELIGKSSWIAATKKLIKGKGSIKAVPMDRKYIKADTDKLLNIDEYALNKFTPLVGIEIKEITSYIRGIDEIQ